MARLNESAAPGESLESLKRRFVRQNREIARVNSIQSLRIRSLESEVSHLLAENVSLREQVIALGNELERFEAAKLLSDGVYDIKAKLDTKLAELNNIVSNLGALPRNFNKTISQNDGDAAQNVSDQHSSALKPQVSDSNQDIEEDGRLPVILEDKYYPRKTLEANELRDLANENVSNAFESGAQYLEVDNAQADLHDDPLDTPLQGDDPEFNAHYLPPTLETRKKKRPSPLPFEELPRPDHNSITPKKDSGYLLKSGAKRKFSSEEDEEFQPISTADDDFEFSRPNQSPENTEEELSLSAKEESPAKRRTQLKERRKNVAPPKRKALEPKNTNTRMVSPGRPRKGISLNRGKRISTSDDSQDDENRHFRSVKSTDQHDPRYKSLSEDLDHDDTEAAERKEPENVRAVSESQTSQESAQFDMSDTPTDQAENSSRPTRRQRAVVSYAEPNLRAKMRRPTSEFIAAVGGDQGRRVSGSQPSRKSAAAGGSDNGRKSREPEPTLRRSESPGLEASDGSSGPLMEKGKTLPENRDSSPGRGLEDDLPLSISIDRKHQKESDNKFREPRSFDENRKKSTKNTLRALSSLSKQSRRHSSNPTAATNVSSMGPQQTFDSAAALHEGSIQQIADFVSSEAGLDTEPTVSLRRGQRAASRRKSMML
ncbi:hypothetical protein BJX96DRAFT_112054 [Aspergillus floccosus]